MSFKETFPYILRESLKYVLNRGSKLKHSLKPLNDEDFEQVKSCFTEVGYDLKLWNLLLNLIPHCWFGALGLLCVMFVSDFYIVNYVFSLKIFNFCIYFQNYWKKKKRKCKEGSGRVANLFYLLILMKLKRPIREKAILLDLLLKHVSSSHQLVVERFAEKIKLIQTQSVCWY